MFRKIEMRQELTATGLNYFYHYYYYYYWPTLFDQFEYTGRSFLYTNSVTSPLTK